MVRLAEVVSQIEAHRQTDGKIERNRDRQTEQEKER